MNDIVELDVRPILEAGGEPFGEIMTAIAALGPHQQLRLLVNFKPVPLFQVLQQQGFEYEAIQDETGDWHVTFSRSSTDPASVTDIDWSVPATVLDLRELEPPEPMKRVLEVLETLEDGAVLRAVLLREPLFLFPELAKRGHIWKGSSNGSNSYVLEVRATLRDRSRT